MSISAQAKNLVTLSVILSLLGVASALGAVTVDNSSSSFAAGQASLTWQHTVNAGGDPALIVGLSFDGGSPGPVTVTYAGNPLSLIGSLNAGANAAHHQLWELVPPPVGTADIVVTLSSAEDFVGGAVSFFGVDPTVPWVTRSTSDGQGSPISSNVNTAVGEMVVQSVAVDRGPALTVGAANTEHWNTGPASVTGTGSTTPGTGGSVNLSWTFSGNDKWVQGYVILRPTGSSTYQVNSTGDAIDLMPGDDACDTGGTNAIGAAECTLRAAIEEANASTAPKLIHFDIPTLDPGYNGTGNGEYTIRPGSAFPNVTEQLWLDGTTQPGYSGTPIIELDGTNAGVGVHGITLSHTDSTVRGLVINRFDGAGLYMGNARSTLEASYIGLDVTGSIDRGNGGNGITVQLVGSCAIGGTAPGAGNVISGNGGNGVSLFASNGATVQGNIIGLDAGGTVDLGNDDYGIRLFADDALIGGTLAEARNILSGNASSGILVEGDDNIIQGNFIGTDITGTIARGNSSQGILVVDPTDRLRIGGADPGARNIISGNSNYGVQIQSASNNEVTGNYIGTDAAGTSALPNNGGILFVGSSQSNTIGGSASGEGNLIAFNSGDGVYLTGVDADNNRVSGNSIYENAGLGIDIDPDGVGTGSGANNDKAAPTIDSILPSGAAFTVVVTTVAGDTVEFFRADNSAAPVVNPDGSGAGEGYLFLGSCIDNAACSGPHVDPVADADVLGGVVQLTILASGLSGNDFLSATATDISNNTSEFAVNIQAPALPPIAISGTVFEDVNYGGGIGRDYATAKADAPSFTVERGGVTVELYDAAGSFVSSTTTAVADGSYSFGGLTPASYSVRVVNTTVTSSRPGSDGSELGVQTYRADGVSEAAGDGAKKVGGELPSNEDAAANSGAQILVSLQGTDVDADSITEWTQSVITVDAGGGDVTGVDFGFNFDVIVNTNDAGQGSLGQFILNSNVLD